MAPFPAKRRKVAEEEEDHNTDNELASNESTESADTESDESDVSDLR